MIIRHNISALDTENALSSVNNKAAKTLQKLSSGYRINHAGDDAAGLAISEKMRARLTGSNQALNNIQDGISLLMTTDGALEEYAGILQRMRTLSEEAANGTYTSTDRDMIQREFEDLTAELDRIAKGTKFNHVDCLAPTKEADNTPTQPSALDIVFVLDRTGSMGSKIMNIKNNLDQFVGAMSGVNLRLGIVDYTDGQSPEVKNYGFFTDMTEFKNKLDVLASHTPGGTENGLDAIEEALTMDFAPGSSKHIILLGDEPIFSRNNKYTISQVKQDMDAAGVEFTLIGNQATKAPLVNAGFMTDDDYIDISSNFATELEKLGNNIVSEIPGADKKDDIFDDPDPVLLQIGPDTNDTMLIKQKNFRPQRFHLDVASCRTLADASNSLAIIDNAINETSAHRGTLGAYQNRLQHTFDSLSVSVVNLTAAESRIRDTDMANEMLSYTKQNILTQAAQAMLGHANIRPQGILQLIG